ncbi:MAG: hypothetical protein ACR2NF_04440 [Pirellulales bacterium]
MIVKTKGILDENGVKHFEITSSSGDIYIAMRQPNGKFTIGDDGVSRTLKQCKDAVVNDAVVYFADATEAPEAPEGGDTWSCVDANALLIIVAAGGTVDPAEIDRTLDANGWLKPDGQRDALQARENLEKWSK